MSTRTRTEDGLVHGRSIALEKNADNNLSTLCVGPGGEDLPEDTPITCFDCLCMLNNIEALGAHLRNALKDHIGRPLTPEREREMGRLLGEVLDEWTRNPREI